MTAEAVRPAVLVGVDGSVSSLRAVELAAAEAAYRGAALRVVHVREPVGHWTRVPAARLGDDADEILAIAHRRAARCSPGLVVDAHCVDGLPTTVLIELSGEACLTMLGQRGRGGFPGLPAGSVCTQVATRGRGPVVVARGGAAVDSRAPVVVGIDVAEPRAAALEFAFVEAVLRDVALRAVYAFGHRTVHGFGHGCADAPFGPAGNDVVEAPEQAARLLAEAVDAWSEKYPDIDVECVVDGSLDPPNAVLSASNAAGLVVIGPHDQSALRHLVLGSVGQMLMHHAPCPVAVVHRRHAWLTGRQVRPGADGGRRARPGRREERRDSRPQSPLPTPTGAASTVATRDPRGGQHAAGYVDDR